MLQLGPVRQRNPLVACEHAGRAGSVLHCNLSNAQAGAFAPFPAFLESLGASQARFRGTSTWSYRLRHLPRRALNGLAFDERLLDHKMTGLTVAAFEEAARFEHLAQLVQHSGASAHHDSILVDIERRLAYIVEQLF